MWFARVPTTNVQSCCCCCWLFFASIQEDLKPVLKILLYAPSNASGLQIMKHILDELDIEHYQQQELQQQQGSSSCVGSGGGSDNDGCGWLLLPMLSSTNLQDTNLGDILQSALERARN